MRAHFTTPDKPSQTIAEFMLTQHDYENIQYICKHAEILNKLIKIYSNLDLQYPIFSDEQIRLIPSSLILDCSFDITTKKVSINDNTFSQQEKFVLLYLQTIELIQIFIDIYNEFERKGTEQPLIPLKNGI